MKKLYVLALLAVFCPINAFAADKQPGAPTTNSHKSIWSGFYAGANGGADIQMTQPSFPAQSYVFQGTTYNGTAESIHSSNTTAFLGGIQGGYDHRLSKYVVGFQVASDWTSNNGSGHYTTYEPTEFVSAKTTWTGLFTGRAGYTVRPKSLVYVKSGIALRAYQYSDIDPAYSTPFSTSGSGTRMGWVAGGGFEQKIKPHWSVFGEFDYTGLGTDNVTMSNSSNGGYKWHDSFQINAYQVLGGVNYHF